MSSTSSTVNLNAGTYSSLFGGGGGGTRTVVYFLNFDRAADKYG